VSKKRGKSQEKDYCNNVHKDPEGLRAKGIKWRTSEVDLKKGGGGVIPL